ncbi:MAG: hypothetical protein ACE5K0_08625 [Candidatus Methanofastidiosia archaeon]
MKDIMVSIKTRIINFWFFFVAILILIAIILYFVWFKFPTLQNFIAKLIEAELLAALVMITYYYARESRRSRRLQEKSEFKKHYDRIKDKLIKPWIKEIYEIPSIGDNLFFTSQEIQVKMSESFGIENHQLFKRFFSHFPEKRQQWKELKQGLKDYNETCLKYADLLKSQAEKTFGLKVEQYGDKPGTMSSEIVVLIGNNLIKKELGERYELGEFRTQPSGDMWELLRDNGHITYGTSAKITHCKDIFEENKWHETEEIKQVIEELKNKGLEVRKATENFKSQLKEIIEYPKFPNKCGFCPV